MSFVRHVSFSRLTNRRRKGIMATVVPLYPLENKWIAELLSSRDSYFFPSKWVFSTSGAKVACDLLNVVISVGHGSVQQ
jgi:hypothetical protein